VELGELLWYSNNKEKFDIRKIIRILFLISPIILLGFAIYENNLWHPPLNPNVPQYISINDLRSHPEAYPPPMKVIMQGLVINKNKTSNFLILEGGTMGPFRVNCSNLDISFINTGVIIYLLGVSYFNDPSKNYFLAENFEIQQPTYTTYLSIPGALLILIILFVGFKFSLKDFSFSRKTKEGVQDA